MALLAVTLAALLPLLRLMIQGWEEGADRVEAQQHLRIAMEEVLHELLYACRVEVDAAGKILTYYKRAAGEEKRYRLYISGKQLLLQLPEGVSVPLAACVDSLAFAPSGRLAAGEVLTVTLETSQAGQKAAARSAVRPRNLPAGGET
ncbi:MAG: hypothetical protein GX167_06035 [Firmicutes bacterium]|jgi:hypothetical protein|nr:hypothetical protein [Bacillota bacterium]